MFRVQSADGQATSAPTTQNASMSSPKPHVPFASTTKATPPSPPAAAAAAVVAPTAEVPPVQDEDVEMKEDADEEKEVRTGGEAAMSSFDALQLLRDGSFDAVSRTAITTLMKIVTNILSDPGTVLILAFSIAELFCSANVSDCTTENEKIRSIRLSNAAFHRSVGQVKGGLEFLQSLGFALVPETQTIVLSPSPQDKGVLQEGLRLLNVEANDLNIAPDTRPTVREKRSDPSFDVFKTQITRVQVRIGHTMLPL